METSATFATIFTHCASLVVYKQESFHTILDITITATAKETCEIQTSHLFLDIQFSH